MRLLLSMLAACTLAACANTHPVPTTPHWDNQFGDNARATLARQVIDPRAGRNADPVAGMDGRAAHAGYERYQRTYSGATPAPAFMISGDAK
ncbi:MAG TPA: hypothetical protein VN089_18335 [Duganella sp.]|nr:hypothetical protein [Duganella sp.]